MLESTSVSYGKATPYFPVIDLLKRYCHVDDGDDARTIRAKVTGQVLTLDATLQDTFRRCWRFWTPRRATVPFCGSTRTAAPAHPRRTQAGAAARKPGAAPAPGV